MKKFIFLIVTTVITGALPLFVQYGDYVLMDDFFSQEIPFIMETKRMLSSGVPFWSWNTFFGDNFIAGYSFYTLTSPFVWLNCLVPFDLMLKSLFLTLILKYICAFLSARLYLRKMEVSKENAALGGMMYAFSSYAISNSYYYHFFEPMIVFPLLLVAVERFLGRDRYGKTGLMLAAFLTVFVNYYFAVCSFVAAAMYVFCRVLFSGKLKEYVCRVPLGGLLIAMGILLDSFLLVPTAMHISGGARANQGILSGFDITAVPFFVERLRTLFMPQVLEERTTLFQGTGFNSCSATLPVIGILLAMLYCWKNMRSWITALVMIALFSFLTPLNSAFSLFTNPNYTRWAYALTLFLILASVKWMDSRQEGSGISVKTWAIYGGLAACAFAFSLTRGEGLESPTNQCQFVAYTLMLLVGLVLLFVYGRSKCSQKVLLYGILVCAGVEMLLFNFLRSDIGFRYAQDKGRKDIVRPYLIDSKLARNDNESTMRYRTAFEGKYPNLGLLTNTPSVSTFHSVLNANLYKFVTITDTAKVEFSNTFEAESYRRSFYALMSVREIIKRQDNGFVREANKDYVPMGFTYDTYLPESKVDSLLALFPRPDVPLVMLSCMIVPDEENTLFSKYLECGKIDFQAEMDSVIAKRRAAASLSFEGDAQGFVSKVNLPRKSFVFYSVPADKGFTAYVDGKETPIYKVNLGLSAVLVPQGNHEVRFTFVPKGMKEGAVITALMFLLLICIGANEKMHIKNYGNI